MAEGPPALVGAALVRALVVGSGPSLTTEDCDAVRRYRQQREIEVWAVNTSYRRAPFCDHLYACDVAWWRAYHDEARKTCPEAKFWSASPDAWHEFKVNTVQSVDGRGCHPSRFVIHSGTNSGIQAVELAAKKGAGEIILLGFDFDGTHWHADHPDSCPGQAYPWRVYREMMQELCAGLADGGTMVYNASRQTSLSLPRLSLAKALA